MRFVHPDLLWWLLALPALALVGWWSSWRRRRALQAFSGGRDYVGRFDLQVSVHRRAIRRALTLLALTAVIVALARPQWGERMETVTRRGIDVVIVLDHSLSMAAEDLVPSRLEQARHAARNLLRNLPGNRVALVTFAGQASVLCPLTLDHGAVELFLETVEPERIQVPGTALADALRVAVDAFGDAAAAESRSRAIVLFSDGEDHEGGLEPAIGLLDRAGIPVFAIGTGSTRGAPIPIRDERGSLTGYKKDAEERVVTTRLDEAILELLALDTGGRYYRATPTELEIEEIGELLGGLDAREYGSVLRTRSEERFQWPLGLAILGLLAEACVGDRRRAGGGR